MVFVIMKAGEMKKVKKERRARNLTRDLRVTCSHNIDMQATRRLTPGITNMPRKEETQNLTI
jgi:hypothetical protein